MRKIVLAHLSYDEQEEMDKSNRNYRTFQTLLSNQFLSDEQKSAAQKELIKLEQQVKDLVASILKKHNVPYVANMTYQTSPNSSEIYIEVYGQNK